MTRICTDNAKAGEKAFSATVCADHADLAEASDGTTLFLGIFFLSGFPATRLPAPDPRDPCKSVAKHAVAFRQLPDWLPQPQRLPASAFSTKAFALSASSAFIRGESFSLESHARRAAPQ